MGERGVPAAAKTASELLPKLDETQKISTAYVNDVVTPNCSQISPVAPEKSPEVLKLLDTIMEELCYGKISAQQAAEKLFKEANEILK